MQIQLFNRSWPQYLQLLFSLIAVGFLASGIVTWIASNWEYFSKFQKLYTTQGFFALCFLGVGIFLPKKIFASEGFAFISAVMIGVLFALIGQIYQTGADPWELFAWWSVLQLPLVFLLPNIGNALLLIATTNLTITVWGKPYYYSEVLYISVGVNLLLLFIIEGAQRFLSGLQWKILSNIQHILFLISVLFLALDLQSAALFLAVSVVGLLWFLHRKNDMTNVMLYYVATIVSLDILLLTNVDGYNSSFEGTLLLVTIITVVGGGWGISQLKTLFPNIKTTWISQILIAFLILLGCIFFLALIFLIIGKPTETGLIIASVIFFSLSSKKADKHFIAHFFVFLSVVFAIIAIFLSKDIDISTDTLNTGWLSVITLCAYTIILFSTNKPHWLRILTLIATLFAVGTWWKWSFFFREILVYGLILATVACFYWQDRMQNEKAKDVLISLGWAGLIISTLGFPFIPLSFEDFEELSALADLYNNFESSEILFHIITHQFFLRPWFLREYLHLAVCLLPCVTFWVLNSQSNTKLPAIYSTTLTVILGLFGILFISNMNVAFLFALLILAYYNRNILLFGFAILDLVFTLGQYYYFLTVPLLHKSFLLLGFGVIFIALSLWLWRLHREKSTSITWKIPTLTKASYVVFGFAVTILGSANYLIHQFEDVLDNGQSVILELAPVDPRSIMQGDYMELNYQLADEVTKLIKEQDRSNDDDDEKETRKYYVLVNLTEQNIATVCDIQPEKPTNYNDCAKNIYLPVKRARWQWQLPTHSYFFPEGKGKYFAQAKYGEYRVKNGKALLWRLLDEQLKPL